MGTTGIAARHYGFDQQPQEVFDITIPEPPRSPRPAWNAFVVRLPRFSRILEPLTKRQFHLNKSPPGQVRWDILSFVPPVKGMTRRDFSLNDVLFPKTQHVRRYVVSLHKPNSLPREVSGLNGTTGSKVRVAPRVNGAGAFGGPAERLICQLGGNRPLLPLPQPQRSREQSLLIHGWTPSAALHHPSLHPIWATPRPCKLMSPRPFDQDRNRRCPPGPLLPSIVTHVLIRLSLHPSLLSTSRSQVS